MKSGSIAPKNHVRLRILRIIDKMYKPIQASMKLIFIFNLSSTFIFLSTY